MLELAKGNVPVPMSTCIFIAIYETDINPWFIFNLFHSLYPSEEFSPSDEKIKELFRKVKEGKIKELFVSKENYVHFMEQLVELDLVEAKDSKFIITKKAKNIIKRAAEMKREFDKRH